ncbi:MAG: hypothetical protein AMXMBFR44_4120 [Candidatus Campbellbacteria bacterium]
MPYHNTMRHIPYILVSVIALTAAALLAVSFLLKSPEPELQTIEAASTTPQLTVSGLEAKAALVLDVRNNRVLYELNADDQLPLASITKILTVLVAHELFPTGTIITITEGALAEEGESGLSLGEQWDIDNLLKFVLVTSSNDGAAALRDTYNALGGEAFVPSMDRRARELGLLSFSIRNATGLDASDTLRATNYGSARDVATLFLHALREIPDILDATRAGTESVSSLSRVHKVSNTNEIIDSIPNAVGGKTGFTDAAGGNLVMSFDRDIGSPIIVVVLGSSKEGRFTDMQKLVAAVRTQGL